MSCGCGHNDCGCETVKGRRGSRGLQGPVGLSGQNAQLLYGLGVPLTSPPVTTAPAQWMDTATDGHYWIWSIAGQNWNDSGVQVQGFPGADGDDGVNAYTTLTAVFTVPAAQGFATATVESTEWMAVGQVLAVATAGSGGFAGFYLVNTIVDATHVLLQNLRDDSTLYYQSNNVSGTVASGQLIVAAGIQGPYGVPPVVLSGSGAPGVAPNSNSGLYAENGGNWWTWSPGGPWVDTGIPVSGPQGDPGVPGYSPQVTYGTLTPSGGNNGDIYFQQVNQGQIKIFVKQAGVWMSAAGLTANRLLGWGVDPTPPSVASLNANIGDQWITVTGSPSTVSYYRVNNALNWELVWSMTTGGGGGGGDLPSTIAATAGYVSGTIPVNWQRTNFNIPLTAAVTSPGATYVFKTAYAYHDLSIPGIYHWIDHDGDTLAANKYSEFVFRIVNTSAVDQVTLEYATGKWSKNPGVTQPTMLNPGEWVAIHAYNYGSRMNIVFVVQDVTVI